MLRRNLPLWKVEETIAETIGFCLQNRIGEIVWKVDAEDFNHGFTCVERQQAYVEALGQAQEEQKKHGIVFSINPWLTLCHADRNRYPDAPPEGFSWRVMSNGKVARERACPLSPGWKKWFLDEFKRYAGLKPARLWVEDDFKTFCETSLELGCFCPEHLQAFGWRDSRESLAEAIKHDAGVRKEWLDFTGKIMVERCRELEVAVHEISPNTQLGFMCSWSTDGRWWKEATEALSGDLEPLSRSSLAPYSEVNPMDFLPDSFDILKEISSLPENCHNCPELENSPYTEFSKSAALSRLQILNAFFLGSSSITMNLFDMVGTPIPRRNLLGRMLRNLYPYLETVRSLSPVYSSAERQGVVLPYDPNYWDCEPCYGTYFDGAEFARILQGAGIPVVMNGKGSVTALTGESVRAIPDEKIKKILSGGVLLDGRAAAVLSERGYSNFTGVQVQERLTWHEIQLSAERDECLLNSGREEFLYATLSFVPRSDCAVWKLEPQTDVRQLTVLLDRNFCEVLPGVCYFENALGGKVAVLPFELTGGELPRFMNYTRAAQFRKLYSILSNNAPALIVEGGAWMMPIRWDLSDCTIVGTINFTADELPDGLTFRLYYPAEASEIPQVKILRKNGKFQKGKLKVQHRKNILSISLNEPVLPYDAVLIRVEHKTNNKKGKNRKTSATF